MTDVGVRAVAMGCSGLRALGLRDCGQVCVVVVVVVGLVLGAGAGAGGGGATSWTITGSEKKRMLNTRELQSLFLSSLPHSPHTSVYLPG